MAEKDHKRIKWAAEELVEFSERRFENGAVFDQLHIEKLQEAGAMVGKFVIGDNVGSSAVTESYELQRTKLTIYENELKQLRERISKMTTVGDIENSPLAVILEGIDEIFDTIGEQGPLT